jgi:hypothetical protein
MRKQKRVGKIEIGGIELRLVLEDIEAGLDGLGFSRRAAGPMC